jgi:putative glutamine amidotransferase
MREIRRGSAARERRQPESAMPNLRPVIGLTSDVRIEKRTLAFVFESYLRRVQEAGGLPLVIPPLKDEQRISEVLAICDAIVLVGGEDIDPREYGEEPLPTHQPLPAFRERFDLALARRLLEAELPVLGICYGCQLLAVAAGGSLIQDIPTQVEGALAHSGVYPDLPTHPIEIEPGTRLHAIFATERLEVNSAHHQAPRSVGDTLLVSARAPDGVIEAFEGRGERFLVGVEWHPDLMPEHPEQMRLFAALVNAARRARV